MRTRTVLALGLLLTLAGCAREGTGDDSSVASAAGGTPTPSASATAERDRDAPVKYAKCMREHGMTWFPDAEPGKPTTVRIPSSVDKSKFDAAQQACKQWAPDGGDAPKMDAAALEQVRLMAKCMRENGVPNFPDPEPDGRLELNSKTLGLRPGDTTFDKAEKICDKYRPSPPPGAGGDSGPQTHREGE